MKKTLTGILLATSVLAIGAVQPVSAASTGTGASSTGAQSASSFKEIHFVTFQNGRLVDIKEALAGSAASNTSHPDIANYKYTSSREEEGILYHMYAPTDTTSSTNSIPTNPYHRDNDQNNSASTDNNHGSTSSSNSITIKTVRFVEYKKGSDIPIDIKAPRTGTAASDTSHPDIPKYKYSTGKLVDGVLFHVYTPEKSTDNTGTTNNSNVNNSGNSNPNNANANNGASNNQNQGTTANSGQFKEEGGKVYYIKDGKKVTGWQKIDGDWYYFSKEDGMKTGWLKDGSWYYLDETGVMRTGWKQVDGNWYYLNDLGAMQTGWKLINGSWYHLDSLGKMSTRWIKENGTWYYLDGSGAMQTGWKLVDGKWYYLNNSGAMQTGWLNQSGTWYYLDGSGAMKTGWFKVDGKWYYSYPSGALAVNTTIDGYTVNANGEWV